MTVTIYFSALLNRDRRGWHDRLAGTRVIGPSFRSRSG
jgi:uncharacterized RDD family membrane protein YckC